MTHFRDCSSFARATVVPRPSAPFLGALLVALTAEFFSLPASGQSLTAPSAIPVAPRATWHSSSSATHPGTATTFWDGSKNFETPSGETADPWPVTPPPLADSDVYETDLDDIQQRILELEKFKDELEKSGQDKTTADTKAPTLKSPKQTDSAEIPSDKWSVRLGGHVQLDYVVWPDTDPAITSADATNYFNFRRLRLLAEGVGYQQFDFRLQLTLEPGFGADENQYATADVKDAYLSMNEIPYLGRLRIGNFFVPFGLEQVTNDTNNIFTERSIPTQAIFTVDREVGLAVYNCTLNRDLTWSGGIFFDDLNDTFKTRVDDNQGFRLSGRWKWLPYFDEPSDGRYLLHLGTGILYTDDYDDTVRFRARPQVQRGPILIDSGVLPAGNYTNGNLELALVWGPIALQSEAYLSAIDQLAGDTIAVGGAYAHLSYFLTGENRKYERFGQHGAQFGRNRPNTNFHVTSSGAGPGAWEAKVRWSNLTLSSIDRGQYNDLTAGFNWYWSDRTRWMFDWIHPLTTAETVYGSTESDLIAMRFDFNW